MFIMLMLINLNKYKITIIKSLKKKERNYYMGTCTSTNTNIIMAELPILTTDCRKEVMQIEIVYTRPILTKRKFYLLTMKYNYITASYKEQSPQFRA